MIYLIKPSLRSLQQLRENPEGISQAFRRREKMKKVVGLLLIATLLLVATAIVAFLKDKQNSDLRIAKLNVEMKLNNAKRQVQSMEGDVVRIYEGWAIGL